MPKRNRAFDPFHVAADVVHDVIRDDWSGVQLAENFDPRKRAVPDEELLALEAPELARRLAHCVYFLWKTEDAVRLPEASDEALVQGLRMIHRLNALRNRYIGALDDRLLAIWPKPDPAKTRKPSIGTFAFALDQICTVNLKVLAAQGDDARVTYGVAASDMSHQLDEWLEAVEAGDIDPLYLESTQDARKRIYA